METKTLGPLANNLLAGLPREDFQFLNPYLTVLPLAQSAPVLEADEEIEQVTFPLSGMVSLLVILKNGEAIETATVGREGVVGAMAGLGLLRSQVRGVMQLSGAVARVSATQFRKSVAQSPAISRMCIRYNETLLVQARITAACNILHPIEARFCRWLLQSRERAESDTVALTQEFLSEMLGVRRTSVTEVAGKLQEAGTISYSRGVIKILDLPRLRELSCECYENLREQAC